MLYEPICLLKNIKNNWLTEKLQKLKFIDPETEQTVIEKWSALTRICKLENDSFVKLTQVNSATFYPGNSEKQKVSLITIFFNKKILSNLRVK